MAEGLGASPMAGISARAGVSMMRPKRAGDATCRMYKRLGVAAADLDDEERDSLASDATVAAVLRNEMRSIPRPIKGSLEALGGGGELDSITAYLHGMRDATDAALGFISGEVSLPRAVVRQPQAQARQSTTHSWCLDLIGIDRHYAFASGAGVKVAVLDTGVDLSHPDFNNVFVEGDNAVSFVSDETVQDGNGHGTHCTGIVGGPKTSSGGRRYGVAPDVDLLVGKVLNDQGVGYDDEIIDGIDWAEGMGARVISMSLGSERHQGRPYSELYELTASNLFQTNPGVLIAAAAGNGSNRPHDTMPVENPAACPSIMAVAAVNQNRRIASFSCRQMDGIGEVNVSAPGVAVYSSWSGGGYQTIPGTSMAAPHVAGVAALIAERAPALTAPEIWRRIERTAERLGDPRDFGAGLVQAPRP